MIQCGSFHSIIVLENGKLLVAGDNKSGQLGLGTKERSAFQQVPFDKKVFKVCSGDSFTLLLTRNGHVFACGRNDYGQLGLNDTLDRSSFEWVKALETKRIRQIECGYDHSCALTDDGFIYTWGNNKRGQLGHGDTQNKYIPTLVNGINKIKKIYCGGSQTFALNEDDELYVWGNNECGTLGLGDKKHRFKPECNTFFKNKKIKKLAVGSGHCIAILDDGVYTWGENGFGQLGFGNFYEITIPKLISFFNGMNVINVFAFYDRSFILLNSNSIYAIGCNHTGELALPNRHTSTPQKVKFPKHDRVLSIVGGYSHTFFITEDNIYGVGENLFKQFGDDFKASHIPTIINI